MKPCLIYNLNFSHVIPFTDILNTNTPRSSRLLSLLFIYAIPMKNSHENMANS